MSILLKSGEQYFEIKDTDLAMSVIAEKEFEAKSPEAGIADHSLLFDAYSEAQQIGCGCCTDKKSLWAACQ